jgi:hypothetical protein
LNHSRERRIDSASSWVISSSSHRRVGQGCGHRIDHAFKEMMHHAKLGVRELIEVGVRLLPFL